MTTVAAVDCGTNSVRLLILRSDADGKVSEVSREVRMSRLGQGVDETGEFHPDALRRTFEILDEYATIISGTGVDQTRLVATSAARDVSNRAEFFDGVRRSLGIDADVISGAEEARLTTEGVLSGVGAAMPVLVIDVGGGSTELVVVEEGHRVSHAISLQMGAVRITERFLRADPPAPREVEEARAHINRELDGAGVDFGRIETAIGVAGTFTTFAARVLGLDDYDRMAVHRTVLSSDDITGFTDHWLRTPVAEIQQEPCMPPLRAQVIAGGGLILDEISARIDGGDILVSGTDILDGIALELLDG